MFPVPLQPPQKNSMQPPAGEETMLGNGDVHYLSLTLYDHLWMLALHCPTTAGASEQGPGPANEQYNMS